MKICPPWKMIGHYADGEEIEVGGNNEEECVEKLCALEEKHGWLNWYTGITDEDYQAGEYIGRDNFIYD